VAVAPLGSYDVVADLHAVHIGRAGVKVAAADNAAGARSTAARTGQGCSDGSGPRVAGRRLLRHPLARVSLVHLRRQPTGGRRRAPSADRPSIDLEGGVC
jgi:hypothetical protein